MDAEIVAMRLIDLGAEVRLEEVKTLMGAPAAPAAMVSQSPVPASVSFPKPLEAWLAIDVGNLQVRLHTTGVVAFRVRWKTQVQRPSQLREVQAGLRIEGKPLDDIVQDWVAQVRKEVLHALREPYNIRVSPEHWTAYVITVPGPDVAPFLTEYRVGIAALVSDTGRDDLVPERIETALRYTVQYSPQDAVILGWDHAVLLGAAPFEDALDVMELANLELLEFRTYDAYLDERLDASFTALDRLWARSGLFRSARTALRDISQVRVELARLTDTLHDTGKLFGDWYTAQMHRRLQQRLHIEEWEQAVQEKAEALEDMFHLAQEESNHRRALLLEAMIVLLFILDLVLLFRVG